MATITIEEIRTKSNEAKAVFAKQGTGKVVHISDGTSVHNLLHGITYTRNGSRWPSKIKLVYFNEIESEYICKKCLIASKVGA